MMNWDTRRLTGLIDAALGRKPMDLCVRNCRIVNVFTGSVEQLRSEEHTSELQSQ